MNCVVELDDCLLMYTYEDVFILELMFKLNMVMYVCYVMLNDAFILWVSYLITETSFSLSSCLPFSNIAFAEEHPLEE